MIIARTTDCTALANLHAQCFDERWSAEAFSKLLDAGAVALVANENEERSLGFVLYRTAADETEILSLGVVGAHRQQGLASALVRRASAESAQQGASTMFLEVSRENVPAIGVYRRLGFREVGRRRNYYGPALEAIVLKADLPLA